MVVLMRFMFGLRYIPPFSGTNRAMLDRVKDVTGKIIILFSYEETYVFKLSLFSE